MPINIKTSAMKVKDPITQQYGGIDLIEEAAVKDVVAEAYSPTSPYSVGEYCLYNGDMYICTTAIGSGGETWNSAHWSTTNVADELEDIKPIGFGSCSTAESTTAKEASIDGYILKPGAMPTIKFTYAVPASSKLNISGTGSKSIYISYGGMLTAIPAGLIKAGDTVTFVYNGSQYLVQSIFSQVRAVNKFGNITSLSIEEVTS